jgi:putative addiction module antidote
MVEVKVRKFGNSLGIVLPKEITTRLRTGDGESLFLVEASNGYQLTPYDPEFAKQMKLAEEGMKKYRNTLRTLAK